MLEVSNLVKEYGKITALNHVSFDVPSGRVAVLLGPNGAGKSTAIKSIAGLIRYRGAVYIDGYHNKELEAKTAFGYVPEMPAMFPLLTVREHIIYMAKAYSKEVSDAAIDAILERFELLDKQDKLGSELSKGMMQKVSLSSALIIEPKVIVLDEPMVGLDPKAIKELKKIILELREKGTTVLISTHMLDMVDELWDMVILLDKGIALGTYYRDEMDSGDLESLYFELTEAKQEIEDA